MPSIPNPATTSSSPLAPRLDERDTDGADPAAHLQHGRALEPAFGSPLDHRAGVGVEPLLAIATDGPPGGALAEEVPARAVGRAAVHKVEGIVAAP